MNKETLSTFLTFTILIAGALFLRLYGLNDYYWSEDEAWHLVVASQPTWLDVIKYCLREEVHPPLSFLLWHFALQISHNDIWLRFTSITPGILLIPSAYIFGRNYIGRAAGLAMAAICAFGVMPVIISQTIRAYSLLMLTLTWLAIFAKKYRDDPQVKHLLYYTLCALAAVLLHYGAAFPILIFGSWLIISAIKDKKRCTLLVILHAFLAAIPLGYAFILSHYYGFAGNYGYYQIIPLNYPFDSLNFIFAFPFGSVPRAIGSTLFLLTIIFAMTQLVCSKKWLLLAIIFIPFFALSFADYFRLYPFSIIYRNNLFLFLSPLILYGSFAQICAEKLPKIFCYESLLALLVTVTSIISFSQNNFFRTSEEIGCFEFNTTKADRKLLMEKLAEKNPPENIIVTPSHKLWDLRLTSSNIHDTILTKNLAKFESDQISLYYTAFPGREKNTTFSTHEYQLFFHDLFAHLKSRGEFKKIKTITFFDSGMACDFWTVIFHPLMIKDPFRLTVFSSQSEQDRFNWFKESYDFGWRLHTSKQVLDKFTFKDGKAACGREILLLTFTPKFVEEEILGKNFTDYRPLYKNIVLKRFEEDE
ncbi:MAG: hypothetical protein FJX34_00600 [Alphaproteobacteria bacterium]|nr:hypothetical protein [Alphaproteobacteria bacterium]